MREGTSPATVHGVHRVLSAAVHQAEKWGVVERSPTRLATPPSRVTRQPTAVDPAAVVAIIAAARESDPVVAAAVLVSATIGMRRGELCGLRWSDVDLEVGAVQIRRAVKYGVDREAIEGPTKTHQVRRVALDPQSVVVLREHRRRQHEWADEADVLLADDPYVFTSRAGRRRGGERATSHHKPELSVDVAEVLSQRGPQRLRLDVALKPLARLTQFEVTLDDPHRAPADQ